MRALAAAIALLGCEPLSDPCFAPGSAVDGLAILAVRLDPPDAALRDDGSASEISVQALVVDPSDTDPVETSASLCVAPDAQAPCSYEEQAQGSSDLQGSFAFHFAPSRRAVEEALRGDPLAGYDGARLRVRVVASHGAQRAEARKTLVVRAAGAPANGAVAIEGLAIHRVEHVDRDLNGYFFEPDDQLFERGGLRVILYAQERVKLSPVLSAGAETYVTRDLSGRVVQVNETVTYSFFTAPHAHFSDDVAYEGGGVLYAWLKEGDGLGKLWIVARDSRGAEDFLEVPYRALDQRFCHLDGLKPCPFLDFYCP